MSRITRFVTVLVAVAMLTSAAAAIELGDPAPPLQIAKWVKGKPVDLAAGKGKNVFVIEFWATWCGPCRTSIPHLTELQKKLKDKGVVIVGVTDEELDTVKPFVEKMGDKMDYVVAIDQDNATSKAYMEAFGESGIPTAFVIDKKGAIVWVGHPSGLDPVLDKVVADKYDLAAVKKVAAAKKKVQQYVQTIQEVAKARKAEEKAALTKKARNLGHQIVKDGAADAQFMNEFAWFLLTAEIIQTRDHELAMKAAEAAMAASEGKDASILDTYARALFDTGKKDEAIKQQKKAVEICKDERMLAELKKTLARYEKEAKAK